MAEFSWNNAKLHMQFPEVLQGDWILETLEQELLFTHDPDTIQMRKKLKASLSQKLPIRSQ